MTAPNLIGATTINGKTLGVALANTNATTILNNASSSGKMYRINTLNLSNTTSSAIDIVAEWNDAANLGGTSYSILTTSVPGNSTLSVIDKSTTYYIEENQSIGVTGDTGIVVTCSYEDVS